MVAPRAYGGAEGLGRSVLGPLRPVSDERRSRRTVAAVTGFFVVSAYGKLDDSGISGWVEGAFVAVAAMLVVSALMRWKTPSPQALRRSSGPAMIAIAVGLIGFLPSQLDQPEMADSDGYEFVRQGSVVTEAEIDAVPKGATRAEVRARLGVPSAHGWHRTAHLRCLGYRMTPRAIAGFCFRGGRYVTPAEVMLRSTVAAG
jgi:hypothetical protein